MVLKKKDYRYFDFARQEAEKANYKNISVGCVLVYKNHIIGSGHNSTKTCPQQKIANRKRHFNKTGKRPVSHSMHAEIAALRTVPYTVDKTINWREVKVYIYRISPGQSLGIGLARSCPGCMSELKKKGVQHFFYTTSDGFAYERIL